MRPRKDLLKLRRNQPLDHIAASEPVQMEVVAVKKLFAQHVEALAIPAQKRSRVDQFGSGPLSGKLLTKPATVNGRGIEFRGVVAGQLAAQGELKRIVVRVGG